MSPVAETSSDVIAEASTSSVVVTPKAPNLNLDPHSMLVDKQEIVSTSQEQLHKEVRIF